jgi:hypothetical protein
MMMAWYIDGSISMGNLDVFATDKALGDYRVCMVDCDDETVSEQDLAANARLIAAAPDLLSALEGAYRHFLQHMERDWFDDDDQDAMQKMFDAIAIAKAKGGA